MNSKLNPITRKFVNQRINTITPAELINLANQYHIPLSIEEAVNIIRILRKEKINIANKHQIMRLIKKIEKVVPPKTFKKIINLLKQF
ncbi:hypothetical protein BHF71_06550 [Vulcanibacillus modesticaldus]|uniref:tRNA methyltransferase n=1 Tax=Vulcanibacillus modesticaldus TaxID=337097 RepID=A0A1D2YWL7_9BACI|nr:hypothetical protein BHF71_06550 [Vulcanibacillus modesticaldus]